MSTQSALQLRGNPPSPGGCSPSGTTCKDPPSFPDTANLLTVKTNGSLRQVQGRHGASFACEWDGVSLGLPYSANEPADSTDAFAVVGTDFRRRESFGRQKIGTCLLHRGPQWREWLSPTQLSFKVVIVVTLWLSACPPTQGETWQRETVFS